MKKLVILGIVGIGLAVVVLVIFLLRPERSSSDAIKPLYFYSYQYEDENGSYSIKCPQTKDIDWQLAIYALSAYMQFEAPNDYGPAEIQRNFDENCERNMHIYETFSSRISSNWEVGSRIFFRQNAFSSFQNNDSNGYIFTAVDKSFTNREWLLYSVYIVSFVWNRNATQALSKQVAATLAYLDSGQWIFHSPMNR